MEIFFFCRGLPPLADQQTIAQSDSSHKKGSHEHAKIKDDQFLGIVPFECKTLSHIRLDALDHDEPQPLPWNREADVAGLVRMVLKDAIKAAGLSVRQLQLAPESDVINLRPDAIVVIPENFPMPVGIVEVKSPLHDIDRPDVYGQLLDYLTMLHGINGLECCIGVLTNYKKWRFCWLPIESRHTSLLLESDTHDLDALLSRDTRTSSVSVNLNHEDRTLCSTRCYNYDDPELPRVLATVMRKMHAARLTASNRVPGKPDENRAYIKCTESKWSLSKLPKTPHAVTPNPKDLPVEYYLLAPFFAVSHHRVWTAMDACHNVKVIKFIDKSKCNNDDIKCELDCWNLLWEEMCGPAYLVTNLGNKNQDALVLPYIRCIFGTKDEQRPTRDELKPVVEYVASRGVKHMDLHWRHIGRHDNGNYLMIDLGHVERVENPSHEWIKEAEEAMFGQLSFD